MHKEESKLLITVQKKCRLTSMEIWRSSGMVNGVMHNRMYKLDNLEIILKKQFFFFPVLVSLSQQKWIHLCWAINIQNQKKMKFYFLKSMLFLLLMYTHALPVLTIAVTNLTKFINKRNCQSHPPLWIFFTCLFSSKRR